MIFKREQKNMETIYWTCGGVANMVNNIIARLNLTFYSLSIINTKNRRLLKKEKKKKNNL